MQWIRLKDLQTYEINQYGDIRTYTTKEYINYDFEVRLLDTREPMDLRQFMNITYDKITNKNYGWYTMLSEKQIKEYKSAWLDRNIHTLTRFELIQKYKEQD